MLVVRKCYGPFETGLCAFIYEGEAISKSDPSSVCRKAISMNSSKRLGKIPRVSRLAPQTTHR